MKREIRNLIYEYYDLQGDKNVRIVAHTVKNKHDGYEMALVRFTDGTNGEELSALVQIPQHGIMDYVSEWKAVGREQEADMVKKYEEML